MARRLAPRSSTESLDALAPWREEDPVSPEDAKAASGEIGAELPEGWVLGSLGDVVSVSKKKVEPSERLDVPYLSLEHIEPESGLIIGRGTGARRSQHEGCLLGRRRSVRETPALPEQGLHP